MLFNVDQEQLIQKTSEELKKLIHMPSWAPFVKTGNHKQRPPADDDWWYVRAAAVLRKIYLVGPIGVSKLRVKYGGKKNRGMKPEKFTKGSGSVIRKVLQQLEEAKLIKQAVVGKHKGRVITPKGISILFSTAKSLGGSVPKKVPTPKVEVKKEAPKVESKPEVKEISETNVSDDAQKPKKVSDTPKAEATPVEAKKDDHVVPKEHLLLKEPKEVKKITEAKKELPAKTEQPKEAPETKVSDDAQKPKKVSDTPKKEVKE